MGHVLELSGITFAYGAIPVFENITFRLAEGDFTALIGPNGVGKSTLLKLGLGILKPQAGTVRLFGETIRDFREWQRIGYVPQHPGRGQGAFPATVEEIVAMGRVARLGLFNRFGRRDRHIIDHMLELVGMTRYRHRLLGELSGGQQQRVFVARALAGNPDLIILDEPTAGIDTDARENLYRLLAHLNTSLRVTVLLVSHDVDKAAAYARRLVRVEQGEIRDVEDQRGGRNRAGNMGI